jgi:hypothetical protein
MTETIKPTKKPLAFTRNQAKLLGVISFFPCCWIILLMVVMLTAGLSRLAQQILPGSFMLIFIFTNTLTLALVIFYIVLISREPDLTSEQKYGWYWTLFILGFFAFPTAWYKFVWKANRGKPPFDVE